MGILLMKACFQKCSNCHQFLVHQGCKPCVAELSKLNELNDAIKSMGGEVVGINTETFDGNKTAIKEAKTLLKSQGAKYRNPFH